MTLTGLILIIENPSSRIVFIITIVYAYLTYTMHGLCGSISILNNKLITIINYDDNENESIRIYFFLFSLMKEDGYWYNWKYALVL